jgi:hypothetical protein
MKGIILTLAIIITTGFVNGQVGETREIDGLLVTELVSHRVTFPDGAEYLEIITLAEHELDKYGLTIDDYNKEDSELSYKMKKFDHVKAYKKAALKGKSQYYIYRLEYEDDHAVLGYLFITPTGSEFSIEHVTEK